MLCCWNLASRQSVQANCWQVCMMGIPVDTCRLTSNMAHTSAAAHAAQSVPMRSVICPASTGIQPTPSSLCCKTLVALSTHLCKLLMVCKTIEASSQTYAEKTGRNSAQAWGAGGVGSLGGGRELCHTSSPTHATSKPLHAYTLT